MNDTTINKKALIYYSAYSYFLRTKQIPETWTYDFFCKTLNERNGVIFNDKKNKIYHLRFYPEVNLLEETFPEKKSYYLEEFIRLRNLNQTHCITFNEFINYINENDITIGTGYSGNYYHCNYDTDDEFEYPYKCYHKKKFKLNTFERIEKPDTLV